MSTPPAIVNMSYGGPRDCPPQVQSAVRAAVAKGMILVAAAGNEGDKGNPSDSPANCAGVIAVGAVGDADTPAPWPGSNRQPYVSLSAPGVRMIVHDAQIAAGYGYANGTSDAAAIVSGSLAVVRAHFPNETSRQLVARVLATARQIQGAQGSRNDTFGYGVVLPHQALIESVAPNAPNPIYDALDKLSSPSSSSASTGGGSTSSPVGTSGVGGASMPGGTSNASGSHGSSSTGLVLGIAGGVVVLVAVAVFLVVRNRRPAHPAGPGFTAPWPNGPGPNGPGPNGPGPNGPGPNGPGPNGPGPNGPGPNGPGPNAAQPGPSGAGLPWRDGPPGGSPSAGPG